MKDAITTVTVAVALYVTACNAGQVTLDEAVRVARNDSDVKARQDACELIPSFGGDEAIVALIGFLDDSQLAYDSARGLGKLRDARAVVPLMTRAHARGECADKMVWALGEIGDPSAFSGLEALQNSMTVTNEHDRRLQTAVDVALRKLRTAKR